MLNLWISMLINKLVPKHPLLSPKECIQGPAGLEGPIWEYVGPGSSVGRNGTFNPRVAGSSPSSGYSF